MIEGLRSGSTHGWSHLAQERRQELIEAILGGGTTNGPLHAELDLTDRCNVACYFCNQQDTRTSLQIPYERVVDLIDELVEQGLKSVRLSGGGDPLHHRQIVGIFDHLSASGVVVDNLTTNAVSLTAEIAERLVRHRAREVNVSLNAVDPADYHRMMQVKPALFDRVVANTRQLLAQRAASPWPVVSIQFLVDRENAHRAVEMYDLADAIGCDRIIISAVQQIAEQRLETDRLLHADDAERLLPVFTDLFRRGDASRLEVNLAAQGLGPMTAEARANAGAEMIPPFPTATTFREEDGACFFSWYSTAITGNGNVYPCCQLMQPDGPVLGNVLEGKFNEVWHGEGYQTLREEMRKVLIDGTDREQPAERFKVLPDVCHRPSACWLKNVYFRADEQFYRELSAALDGERKKRARVHAHRRRVEPLLARFPRLRPTYDRLRTGTQPVRRWLTRHLGLALSDSR